MNNIACVGEWEGRSDKKRLLLRISDELKHTIKGIDPYMVAIDLESGGVSAYWVSEKDVKQFSNQYENIVNL